MILARRRLLKIGMASAVGTLPAGDLVTRLAEAGPGTALLTPPPESLAPTPAEALTQSFAPEPAATQPPQSVSRRGLLRTRQGVEPAVRRAFVHNVHTGETLNAVYFEAGRYIPGALAAAMRVLRDWRNGEEHVMDPRLFDLLHTLGDKLDVRRPFQIVSGYRSKATNALMHERSHQVAQNSQHVLGKALDICLEGVDLSRLHRAALSLKAGGVGFYPMSGFVHVDVGPLRQWVGT